jgi:protein-S-isoprenylcysteine O-methyltransferase Ste14
MSVNDSTLETVRERSPGAGWARRAAAYLVQRRVRLTLLAVALMMIEDVFEGIEPHRLTNLHDRHAVLGLAIIVGGLGLRSWAAGVLHKTRELTTTGPYAIIRNPLYVGSFMIMIGFCAIIDDDENVWVVLGPLAGLYLLQVFYEEQKLAGIFGERWQAYAAAVPRFLPRRLPPAPFATWQLSDWIGSREYRALSSVLAGLLAVELWRRF